MAFHPLEKLHKLSDGYRGLYKVAGQTMLLLQIDGKHHIIDNMCPHLGAGLATGDIENETIRCPFHAFLFDLKTGAHINEGGVDCEDKLIIHEVVYEDGVIGVVLNE